MKPLRAHLSPDGLLSLSKVKVGDELYGTEQQPKQCRRFRRTKVLAVRAVMRPAYEVTLSDGSSFLVPRDHQVSVRECGWKFITPEPRSNRPHLTTNSLLMGFGGEFTRSKPRHNAAYQQGYLCGMIRGDGTLKVYGSSHQFRLALVDLEALDRTQDYLAVQGVLTRRAPFRNPRGRPMSMIRTHIKANFCRITELIQWPTGEPSDSWVRGYLAGIFDAEGTCGRYNILRIKNRDTSILDMIAMSLDRLRFDYVMEEADKIGVATVRLRGGLPARLRFFHTVDPAVLRKRSFEGLAVRSRVDLQVVSVDLRSLWAPFRHLVTTSGDYLAEGLIHRSSR